MAQDIEIKLKVRDDGSVVVKEFGDTSAKSLKKASQSTDAFSKSMGALKKVVAGLIALKLGKELLDTFNRTTQLADSIAKLSTRLGVSSDSLQKFQYVAERSGLSAETMNLALQRMIRRASDAANGLGEAQKAFKDLGISTEELIRLSPEQLFLKITNGLDNLNTEGQKVATLFKIFDTEGVGVKQAMAQGAEGVKALFDRFDELNGIMGPDFLKASEEYQDNLTDIKYAWRAFSVYLAGEIIPIINDNIGEIISGIQWLGRAIDNTFHLSKQAKIKQLDEEIAVLQTNIKQLEHPTGFERFGKAVNEFFGHDSTEQVKKLREEINKLMAERNKIAKELEEGKKTKTPAAPPTVTTPKTDKELKAEEEKAKKIAAIQQYQEDLAFEIKQAGAQKRFEALQEETRNEIEAIRKRREEEKKAAEEKEKLIEMQKEAALSGTKTMLANYASFFQEMGKHNKAMFRAYQAFAIAETIISTYEGAQKAFTSLASIPYVGVALGVAAAAAAVAAGLGRVAAIASQKPEGAARGAVVHKPTILEVGEGAKSEAVVPLDNGMQIPVNFRGGGGMGGDTYISIHANDAKSFADQIKRNPKVIIDQVMKGLQSNYGPLTNTLRRTM